MAPRPLLRSSAPLSARAARPFGLAFWMSMCIVLALSCTRNVDDREVYERCQVDAECAASTMASCYRIMGDTETLGICSTLCTADTDCPPGGLCSSMYQLNDGGLGGPVCTQQCTTDTECQPGGFACRGGLCLPP